MSIDNPASALDRALGAEERANVRVCQLEDALSRVAVCILSADLSKAQRKKLIAELRPEFDKVMA